MIFINNVQKIIKEICDEKGISFKLVSDNWIGILEKEDKIKYIVGYKFPLNDQAAGRICDDKYAVYEVMKNYNVPTAEHFIVFDDYDRSKIVEYCKKYGFDMVVKNNQGTCGNDMYHTVNEEDLFDKLDKILVKNHSVSLSPFYDIKTEYRMIVLNDEVELVYGKKKPVVVGDGKKTIYELLCDFNENYFAKYKDDESMKRILEDNEEYEYNWQFNLSKGAMPFFIEDKEKEDILKKRALEIAKILGVTFVSVDLIELYDGSFILLEVNSGVMMNNFSRNLEEGKMIAKRIYTKVIDEMFK